jgi:hypothetical protein
MRPSPFAPLKETVAHALMLSERVIRPPKKPPRPVNESQRMLTRRPEHWFIGTAITAAMTHITAFAETFVGAFEPDLAAWDALPFAHATTVDEQVG